MTLTELSLQQFRSYAKRTFVFSPHTTLIVGPNTAGKTNILEAIALLSTGKSFRADKDGEMVKWWAEFGRVKATIDDTTLEVLVTATKKYVVNGIPRRQIDFVGNLLTVLFWPEHLELITDSPSIRRKYLDSVLVQVDREYRRNLLSYERGIRQRNSLLRLINEGKGNRAQLLFWDQLLIKSGAYITDKRIEFIEFVNTHQHTMQIHYDKSIISVSRLAQYALEEVAAGVTLVGPHRDDYIFLERERDISKYGSRGEQRLAVLRLKLAELVYIEEKTGERPILLLDDIFSELDVEHRKLVLEIVDKQQTIITSADEDIIKLFSKKIDVINI